jgi:thiosulfate/3-mercaptopyruvate sulfurtransferase
VSLFGCASPETRVSETTQWGRHRALEIFSGIPLPAANDIVVLDARTAFDFAAYRVPGSVNIDWREFAQTRDAVREGYLRTDVENMQRRLARLGIGPETSVVVVGYGINGLGEEGRLAWTLYYLGVDKVRFAKIDVFKGSFIRNEPPARANVPPWTRVPRESVIASQEDVRKVLGQRRRPGEPLSAIILDVRSQQEYFRKSNGGYTYPDIGALHVDWREFLNSRGEPQSDIVDKLEAIGVSRKTRVFVISNHGVRSAAVTMALLSLGFEDARNFVGGWNEIVRTNKLGE